MLAGRHLVDEPAKHSRSTAMAPQEFLRTLKDADEIELTVTGRSSGRPIARPVWFVQEGGTCTCCRDGLG